MKFSLVSSLRSAACIALISGAAALASAQTTFQYVNWTPNDEKATAVERTADGGYIMVGNRRAIATGPSAIVLLKVDQFGAQLWQRVYNIPGSSNTAQCIQKTSDGGYIIAGETNSVAGASLGILLLKVDVAGNFMWSKAYAGSAFSGIGGTVVRQTPTGYVLIGRAFGAANAQMAGVYIETDTFGNQTCGLYYRRTDYGPQTFMSFNDIRVNNDGSNTIVGFVRNGDAAPREPLALRVRCTVAPMWAKTYGPNPVVAGDWAAEGMDIRYTATGPVYVMTGAANTAGSFITNFDGNGNLIGMNTKFYPTFLSSQSIRYTPNGEAVISGSVAGGFGGGDAAYMKVAATGAPMFANRDGGTLVDQWEEAIPSADGGIILVGNSLSAFGFPAVPPVPAGQQSNFYYAKAGPAGRTGCNEAPLQISPTTFNQAIDVPLVATQMPQPVGLQFVTTQTLTESSVLCLSKGCITPPANMTLWLPMDEAAGGIANNIAGGNNGFHNALAIPGAPGMVSAAANYSAPAGTFTRVPTYAGIQPGVGDFSIDAWVNPSNVQFNQFIAEKAIVAGATYRGYGFGMFPGGNVFARFGNGGAPMTIPSAANLPSNTWSHLVVTVRRNDPQGIKFYVNGNLITQTSSVPINGFNLNNTNSLHVAAAGSLSNFFSGRIDEVEFFKRSLTALEASNLYTAGASGKCKQWVFVPPVLAFCYPNINTVNGTAQIANYGGPTFSPADYWFNPLSPGNLGSTIWGPTSFAYPAPPAVIPFATQSIPLTIGRPAGMTAVGITGAYEMWGQFPVAGSTMRNSQGVVRDYRNLCIQILGGNNGLGAFSSKVGQFFDITYAAINNTRTPMTATFRVRVIGPDMEPDMRVISLNGLPPGQPWIRTLTVGGESQQTEVLNIQPVMDDPMGFQTILIEADLDGDGEWEPVSSASVQVITPGQCSADFNGDGSVDFFDYLDFVDAFSNADPAADFNADGVIDFFDYLDFVDAFSIGCD